MGRMKDLDAAGVTDLNSYLIGKSDGLEEALRALRKKQSLYETIGDRYKSDAIRTVIAELTPPAEEN